MPSKYATMYTPLEIEEYRARKTREKEAVAAAAQKEQARKESEAAKRRREDLTETLHRRYLASGGTPIGWATDKDRLIRDAISAEVLNPPVEPERPTIAAPFSRRHF